MQNGIFGRIIGQRSTKLSISIKGQRSADLSLSKGFKGRASFQCAISKMQMLILSLQRDLHLRGMPFLQTEEIKRERGGKNKEKTQGQNRETKGYKVESYKFNQITLLTLSFKVIFSIGY